MASISFEYDYISLSESSPPSMEIISDKFSSSSSSFDDTNTDGKIKTLMLNLKDTELRLGLPGYLSPERKPLISPSGVSLFGKELDTSNSNNNGFSFKNLVSGAKRGFSDTIDGSSGKWVLSVGSNGSDVVDDGVLFSPRGDNGNSFKKEGVGAQSPKPVLQEKNNQVVPAIANDNCSAPPAAKAQVVGWPPIRSFRMNTMASNLVKNNEDVEAKSVYECLYVKVSMDGAPYMRKVDLNTCSNYVELSSALEKMFSCFTIGQCGSDGLPGRGDGLSESRLKDILHGSEYVLTYEDKDGDWMLVGDVPWGMFTDLCRRLRIKKGS